MVFFGEFEVSVTSGSRIALPKKIREILNEKQVIITKGFGSCLSGYDRLDWEKRARELLNVSLLDKEHIDKRRKLFSSATQLELDEQGRILLPKNLQSFAEIKNNVLIVGVGDHFEIWQKTKWEKYMEEINE
jgi:MraZ protein